MTEVKMRPESLQIAVKENKDKTVKTVKLLFSKKEDTICIKTDLNLIRCLRDVTEQILRKAEGNTNEDHMVAYD